MMFVRVLKIGQVCCFTVKI